MAEGAVSARPRVGSPDGRRPEGDPTRGRAGTEGDAEYTIGLYRIDDVIINHQNVDHSMSLSPSVNSRMKYASRLKYAPPTWGCGKRFKFGLVFTAGRSRLAVTTASKVKLISKVCSEEGKTSLSGSMFWKAVLSAAHATALSVFFSCRCNTPPTGRAKTEAKTLSTDETR
ncbi:hypothetical protein Bbelb_063850 [Branchiostoma belcheri]|nr:hypothetical protein Bbelb_063850 [Branchiostoma belcheri]